MAENPSGGATPGSWRCEPLTDANWSAFEQLFGKRGACGGCWCMWHRLPRREYETSKGAGNREKLRALVQSGEPVGLIALADGVPIAWCSIAPCEQYTRRIKLPPPYSSGLTKGWAIRCLFVNGRWRRQGVSTRIIGDAVAHAAANGAQGVIASAIIPSSRDVPALFAFQGLLSAYRAAGFHEVERTSATRATVLYRVATRD